MADLTLIVIFICVTICLGIIARIVNIIFTYLSHKNDKNRPNSSN